MPRKDPEKIRAHNRERREAWKRAHPDRNTTRRPIPLGSCDLADLSDWIQKADERIDYLWSRKTRTRA